MRVRRSESDSAGEVPPLPQGNGTGDAFTKGKDPIRVLIVNESTLMRRLLTQVLENDERITVAGFVRSNEEARLKGKRMRPDLLALDPSTSKDERTLTLDALREEIPDIRTLLCATLPERNARLALEFLSTRIGFPPLRRLTELSFEGAPSILQFLKDLDSICDSISEAWDTDENRAPVGNLFPTSRGELTPRRSIVPSCARSVPQVLIIGCSTGGPAALMEILPALPDDFPMPVLIVQHMPPVFTAQLAQRLSRVCKIPVIEAENSMELRPGVALIAPGDFHMKTIRKLDRVQVELTQEEPENSCRPAVDVLFRSVAEVYKGAVVAAVLTGMGQDGLRGVRILKNCGATIFVQDRATSVVWGMPGAVAEAGLADSVLPLEEILPQAMRLF